MQQVLDQLGKNSGFILTSYGVTILIIGGFVWHCIQRYADAKRRFAEKLGPDNG